MRGPSFARFHPTVIPVRFLPLLSLLCTVFLFDLPPANAQSLSLSDAWARFVEQSPLVAAEQEKLQMASGRLAQAGVWSNPSLHYSQEGYPLGLPQAGFNDQEFLIVGWQEFELGGKRGKRKELAKFELEAEQARYSNFLRLKRLEVSRLFVEAFFASRRMALVQAAHNRYSRIREIHQKRYEQGEVSGLAQLKVESEEIWYLVQLSRSERDLNSAWTELGTLIGWAGATLPDLVLEDSGVQSLPDAALVVKRAIESRPDLEALRFAAQAAENAIAVEKAENTPNLTFGGGYKRDFGENSFFVGVQLPLPVWDRRQGAIEEKLADSRRQFTLANWQEIWIRQEVNRTFGLYAKLLEASQRLGTGFDEKMEKTIEITALSYQEGEAGILEYLDAIRTHRDAQLERSRLDEELRLAQLELEAAVGATLREIRP